MRNRNFFQTIVGGGSGGFVTEDGILLKSEILQERATGDEMYQEDKRKWAPNKEVIETDMV